MIDHVPGEITGQAHRCPFIGYRGLDFDIDFRDNVVGPPYFTRLLTEQYFSNFKIISDKGQ